MRNITLAGILVLTALSLPGCGKRGNGNPAEPQKAAAASGPGAALNLKCSDIVSKEFMADNFGPDIQYTESGAGPAGAEAVGCSINRRGATFAININRNPMPDAEFDTAMARDFAEYKMTKMGPNYYESQVKNIAGGMQMAMSVFMAGGQYFVTLTYGGQETPEFITDAMRKIVPEITANLGKPPSAPGNTAGGSDFSGTGAIKATCAGIAPVSFVESTFSQKDVTLAEAFLTLRNIPFLNCSYVAEDFITLRVGQGDNAAEYYEKQLKALGYKETNTLGIRSAESDSVPQKVMITTYGHNRLVLLNPKTVLEINVLNAKRNESAETDILTRKAISGLQ